ncbi:glyoxalase [Solirubrobacter sp. CPCC 204708]|uniref:Glyoxalase n=1 Tax=Solirubrobacter deserti TaxID=2282478 RepID=A0ABT4RM01_9ACTN|nr:VOC family protein [Solirubrobacter deserti]MBE2314428.1 glyoxalase [Solirubrobacter deserti]MDA0139574.1 glyoxalase [Solirubrobacter deserti]
MNRMIFINLPVRDIEATTAFYTSLGFAFNPAFASPQSACMALNDSAFVMWLSYEHFADFTDGAAILDPRENTTAALYALSADSREAVDATVAAAVAAGGAEHGAAQDHGFMYSRAFRDLEGHGWQVMWMDPQAAADGPPDMAETA